MSTLSLKILSDVSSSEDVFDNLVQVQRLDTGEVGELLCSHCCRWPQHLLKKAKWIEGCYTPKSHANDPRLLLGYHPGSITHWDYQETEEGVILHLKAEFSNSFNQYDDDDVMVIQMEGETPLPFFWEINMTHVPRTRVMQRLWRTSSEGREPIEAIQAFYRSLNALVESGRVPRWAARCAWHGILDCIDESLFIDYQLEWAYPEDTQEYCEEYADATFVVSSCPQEGFLPAVTITTVIGSQAYPGSRQRGRRRQQFDDNLLDGALVVSDEAIRQGAVLAGYHPAVSITMYDQYLGDENIPGDHDELVVRRDDPENGWAVAHNLRSFERVTSIDGSTYERVVQGYQVLQGYAPAISIS